MKHPFDTFPCNLLPSDATAARLLGLHPQRQPGLWMQRAKVPGGVATTGQWQALADIGRELIPGTPLHLTTRQDVEVHDLTAEMAPPVQKRLSEAGLTGFGACGDTVRNVTVCPCSGTASGRPDLLGLARDIGRLLDRTKGIYSLPRKFKISLSACREGCGRPWVNDVGFVADKRSGVWGFEVIAGGSLGPRPGTGMRIFDWVEAGEAPACVLAAVRVFAALGDRTRRRRARLRHVRERLGDEEFAAVFRSAHAKERAERSWPAVHLEDAQEAFPAALPLMFDNGDMTPDAADALAALAEREDLRVRIATDHRVLVFGRDGKTVHDAVTQFADLAEAARPKPVVVACPGTRWCGHALTDTNRLADRLRAELAGRLPEETAVCISGCPNGCAHSTVAAIGLVGGLAGRGGEKREVFTLHAGGGMGRDARLAQRVAHGLSADEAVAEIRRLAEKGLPAGGS